MMNLIRKVAKALLRRSPARTVSPAPTLVADSMAVVRDAAGLRLLLCAIFETPRLNREQAGLYRHLAGHPGLWTDREQLLHAIHDYLTRRRQQPFAGRATLSACLRALDVHRQKTAISASAYLTHDKPDPWAVYWPNPAAEPPDTPTNLFDRDLFVVRQPLIDASTPIGSAGSCLAVELAARFQQEGYNYVITERDPPVRPYNWACARWGTVFNTPSFRQLVERAFGVRDLPRLLFSRSGDNGKTVYLEPFREGVVFDSVAEYEANYELHRRAAREALLRSKVFVLTLGLNEVWRLKSDGTTFARAPWGVMPDFVEPKLLTVEENVSELQRALDLLRLHNPGLKLIVSVSPVPMHATFRGRDTDVVTANCHSKSLLRVAAEEFVRRNRDVYYFPGYEVVMYGTRNPWEPDQRHLSTEAVDRVMAVFRRMFVAEGAAVNARAA